MHPLFEVPADKAPTVALDLETTGLHPAAGHRIIEVGVVRSGPAGVRKLACLVDPGRAIPKKSQQIHHISAEMLVGQPTFEALLPDLRELCDGAVLVAHNAPFDLAFLQAECQRIGQAAPQPVVVLDTIELARTVFGLVHCSLTALAERIGLPFENPHRALPDAQMALDVYQAMVRAVNEEKVPTVGELVTLTESLQRGGAGRKAIRSALGDAYKQHRSVVIDYTSGAGGALTTRRRITITRMRPPYVEAQCHLREEPRVFKLDRIRRVVDGDES